MFNIWSVEPGNFERLLSQGMLYIAGSVVALVLAGTFVYGALSLLPRQDRYYYPSQGTSGITPDPIPLNPFLPAPRAFVLAFGITNFLVVWAFECGKKILPSLYHKPLTVAAMTFNILGFGLVSTTMYWEARSTPGKSEEYYHEVLLLVSRR